VTDVQIIPTRQPSLCASATGTSSLYVKSEDGQNLRQLWVRKRGSLPEKYSSFCAQNSTVPISINYEKIESTVFLCLSCCVILL